MVMVSVCGILNSLVMPSEGISFPSWISIVSVSKGSWGSPSGYPWVSPTTASGISLSGITGDSSVTAKFLPPLPKHGY